MKWNEPTKTIGTVRKTLKGGALVRALELVVASDECWGGRREGWCGVAGFANCPSSRWEAVGEPGPRETRTATLREQVAGGTRDLANER
jgi:hypothetical protein